MAIGDAAAACACAKPLFAKMQAARTRMRNGMTPCKSSRLFTGARGALRAPSITGPVFALFNIFAAFMVG
jgi:hypothetical protein